MISPVKGAVGPGYAALDARLARAVHMRFGLPAELPAAVKALIKRADRISAWLEAVRIAGFAEAEADRFFGAPRLAGVGSLRAAPAPAGGGPGRVPRPPRRAAGDVGGRAGGRPCSACNARRMCVWYASGKFMEAPYDLAGSLRDC